MNITTLAQLIENGTSPIPYTFEGWRLILLHDPKGLTPQYLDPRGFSGSLDLCIQAATGSILIPTDALKDLPVEFILDLAQIRGIENLSSRVITEEEHPDWWDNSICILELASRPASYEIPQVVVDHVRRTYS